MPNLSVPGSPRDIIRVQTYSLPAPTTDDPARLVRPLAPHSQIKDAVQLLLIAASAAVNAQPSVGCNDKSKPGKPAEWKFRSTYISGDKANAYFEWHRPRDAPGNGYPSCISDYHVEVLAVHGRGQHLPTHNAVLCALRNNHRTTATAGGRPMALSRSPTPSTQS